MIDNSKLARARALLPQVNDDSLELGRLFLAVRGEGSLNEFCRAVPTHHRKAYYLAEIASAVDSQRLREGDLKVLGWAKAQHILHTCKTAAQINKAVEFARQHTLSDLRAHLSTEGRGKKVSTVFRLEAGDTKLLEAALLANGAGGTSRRGVNREAALMAIVRRAISAPRVKRK
jgi:hypothetical protein